MFVPELDGEHQVIFKLCGELRRALVDGLPAVQLRPLLNELVLHSLEHFWHEERQMRAVGYVHYVWHKQQHHTARVKIKGLEDRLRNGDHEAVGALLAFLHGWLNDHIRLTDRMLGVHLRNRLRELHARAS